jgi:hypothetical protein
MLNQDFLPCTSPNIVSLSSQEPKQVRCMTSRHRAFGFVVLLRWPCWRFTMPSTSPRRTASWCADFGKCLRLPFWNRSISSSWRFQKQPPRHWTVTDVEQLELAPATHESLPGRCKPILVGSYVY